MEKRIFRLAKLLLQAVILLSLSSCLSQKKVKLLQEETVENISNHQFENLRKTTYMVKPGDNLYIKVYSVDPKTSKFFQTDFPINYTSTYLYLNSYIVDEQGYVSFSFIDKLYVKGLTVDQVQDLIQKSLDEYFKDATVFVKLVNFQVAVLGEVNNPGNFTIDQEQINLLQAIGLAGGIKQYGDRDKVILVRQTQNGSEMKYLDLTDNALLQSDYFYLVPDDIIYVEPMNSKSYTYSSFPYQMVLSTVLSAITAGVVLLTYLEVN